MEGVINYKDITARLDYERYLNKPENLNDKAKKYYDELKSGGKIKNEKLLLGENNNIMDGTHRFMARLAMGQTEFKFSKPSEKFFFQNYNKTIAEAYHKAKADGSNPELVKAVEELRNIS